MFLINFIAGTKVGRLIGAVLIGLGALLAMFQMGKREQRKEEHIKDLEEYKETNDDIQDTPVTTDRESALKRLRDNGQFR